MHLALLALLMKAHLALRSAEPKMHLALRFAEMIMHLVLRSADENAPHALHPAKHFLTTEVPVVPPCTHRLALSHLRELQSAPAVSLSG